MFLRLVILSTLRGVHTLIFTYVPYIVIGLHEEPANSYTFVTGHLITFLVVLSLICLVTTQISISENQTILRLEILLRTIVAALLKTKCNGRFVKNKWISRNVQGIFHKTMVTNILLLEQHLMLDYAHPAHPPPHKHTQINKKDSVCLMTSAHPTSSPLNLFSNSHHDECKFSYHTTAQNKTKFIL